MHSYALQRPPRGAIRCATSDPIASPLRCRCCLYNIGSYRMVERRLRHTEMCLQVRFTTRINRKLLCSRR